MAAVPRFPGSIAQRRLRRRPRRMAPAGSSQGPGWRRRSREAASASKADDPTYIAHPKRECLQQSVRSPLESFRPATRSSTRLRREQGRDVHRGLRSVSRPPSRHNTRSFGSCQLPQKVQAPEGSMTSRSKRCAPSSAASRRRLVTRTRQATGSLSRDGSAAGRCRYPGAASGIAQGLPPNAETRTPRGFSPCFRAVEI